MRSGAFQDKVVLITGAASGIGRALSLEFAAAGARLGLLDLDGERVQAWAGVLRDKGYQALPQACDVAEEMTCRSAVEAVQAHYARLDVLVNNAGITQRDAFANTDPEVIRKVMDVNFFGSVNCTKAALPFLLQNRGQIIVTSSIAGLAPLPGRSGYCASKHALHGFFRSLRLELGDQGLRVLLVCPSFVRTNLQTRALGGDGEVTAHPQSTIGKQALPGATARAIVRAAARNRKLLVLSPAGKAARFMDRLCPSFYEWFVSRSLKSEIER